MRAPDLGLNKEALRVAQDWLDLRLRNVAPSDFRERICFYTSTKLNAPRDFEHIWRDFQAGEGRPLMSEADASRFDVVLIVADLNKAEERRCLIQFLEAADRVDNLPPVLLVPHTSEDLAASFAGYDPECLSEALEAGLNGVLTCEPCGFALTLQVRASIRHARMVTNRILDSKHEIRERGVQGSKLKAATKDMLWKWLPRYVGPAIPAVDHSLPIAQAKWLGGFRLGKFLGQGGFGAVFKLQQGVIDRAGAGAMREP